MLRPWKIWSFTFELPFWGAVIGALTRRDDKRTEKSVKWYEATADDNRTLEYERSKRYVQDRTEDARAAGIHPLYALGAGGYQPQGTQVMAPSPTGSGGGVAIGRSLDRYLQSQKSNTRLAAQDEGVGKVQAAQVRRLNSQSTLDELEAMAITSGEKVAEQDAWTSGYGRGTGLPDEITTHRGSGRALPKRPLTEESRRSAPMRMEVVLSDGTKLQVVGKNWDEVSQADLLYQVAVHYASQGMTKIAAWAKARREMGHKKHRRQHRQSNQMNAIKRLRGRPKGPWNQGRWK